jgi:hypothetical protein
VESSWADLSERIIIHTPMSRSSLGPHILHEGTNSAKWYIYSNATSAYKMNNNPKKTSTVHKRN